MRRARELVELGKIVLDYREVSLVQVDIRANIGRAIKMRLRIFSGVI